MAASDLLVRLSVDLSRFTDGFKKAAEEIRVLSSRAVQFSKDNSELFRNAGLAVSAFAATAGLALKKATGVTLEYEAQMARVATMLRDDVNTPVNEVAQNMQRFNSELKDMAVRFGQSTETLADGLYDTLSAGHSAESGLKLVNAAAQVAAGQFAQTKDVVGAMLTALKAYGDGATDAALVSDMLSNTVYYARTTMGEMSASIGRVIPIGKQLGIPLNDLLAIFAELTLSLGSTDMAVTSLGAVLNSFTSPTKEAREAFASITEKAVGFRAELDINTIKQLGFQNALKLISQAGTEAASGIFSEQRAIRALDVIVSKHNDTIDKSTHILNDRNTSQELFNMTQESASFKIKQTEQSIKVALIDTFQNSLPIIKLFSETIGGIARIVSAMPTPLKKAVGALSLLTVGLASVAGPTLLLISQWHRLAATFSGLASVTPQVVKSFGALAAKGAALFAAFEIGWTIGELLRSTFKGIDEAAQKAIGSIARFAGIDLSKSEANTEGLARKLDEVNKKYGIQAASLQEALTIIKERNKAAAAGSDKEIKSIDAASKALSKEEELRQKILSLKPFVGDKAADEEKRKQEEIARLRRDISVEMLELAGREKEAKLENLKTEFEERKRLLGEDASLTAWYQASKLNIEKEYADKQAKDRNDQLVKEFQDQQSLLSQETALRDSLGFGWDGYYEWKKERLQEDMLLNADILNDRKLAETIYVEEIKDLDKSLADFKKAQSAAEVEALKQKLSTMTEANQEYYDTVNKIASISEENKADIIAQSGQNAVQGMLSVSEGVKSGIQDIANTQVNLFQMSQDVVKSGFNQTVDGMSDALSGFLMGEINSFEDFKQGFDNFARSMAKSFIQAVSQMIVKWMVFKALQAAGGVPIPMETGGLIPGFAAGGPVFGASGPGDNVRANLKGGEFVVRKGAVTRETAGQIAAINKFGKPIQNEGSQSASGTIVNFIDPTLFQNYIAKNPDAIINTITADAAGAGKVRSGLRRTL